MNLKGMKEDKGDEVVDPFYIAYIEAFLLLEIYWDSPEEDDLQAKSELVIVRTKN